MLTRDDDGRRLHAVRGEHRRTRRATRRADEREVERLATDAAVDTRSDEAARSGDAHTRIPLRRSPAVSLEAEQQVRVLDRLAGCALSEIVERADHDRHAGRTVGEGSDLGRIRPLDA